jgi:hypothetical protein
MVTLRIKIFYTKFLRIKILTYSAVPQFTYPLVPYSTIQHKVGTDFRPQQISMTLFPIPFPNQKVIASRTDVHKLVLSRVVVVGVSVGFGV